MNREESGLVGCQPVGGAGSLKAVGLSGVSVWWCSLDLLRELLRRLDRTRRPREQRHQEGIVLLLIRDDVIGELKEVV